MKIKKLILKSLLTISMIIGQTFIVENISTVPIDAASKELYQISDKEKNMSEKYLYQLPQLITKYSNDQSTDEAGKKDDTVIEDNANNGFVNSKEGINETFLDIEWSYKFSEGMEWIKIGSANSLGEGYICVNREGNALFFINNLNISYISPFSNGYSFIETDNAIYQIDMSGNIVNSYMISDNVTFKAYEDGKIWIEEYYSDFDSAGYIYTLYDENEKEVTRFSVEGTEPIDQISYCGKGVWRYSTINSNGDWVQMYYCTQSNKWIESPLSSNNSVYFYEDTAVLGLDYKDLDDTGYRAKMIMMDINGNLNEVGITEDLGWNWTEDNYIKDGYCILEDYEDHLVSYNVLSGEFKVMDNEYAEKIRMAALPEKLMFTDRYVALPLRGNDEKDYVGLFDTSWNIVGKPISGRKFDFSEGKLVIAQDISGENQDGTHEEAVVYDTKGAPIFNAFEKGYRTITPYKDGIAYVLDADASSTMVSAIGSLLSSSDFSDASMLAHDWKCIDENGEYLFNAINVDHIKTIELK